LTWDVLSYSHFFVAAFTLHCLFSPRFDAPREDRMLCGVDQQRFERIVLEKIACQKDASKCMTDERYNAALLALQGRPPPAGMDNTMWSNVCRVFVKSKKYFIKEDATTGQKPQLWCRGHSSQPSARRRLRQDRRCVPQCQWFSVLTEYHLDRGHRRAPRREHDRVRYDSFTIASDRA